MLVSYLCASWHLPSSIFYTIFQNAHKNRWMKRNIASKLNLWTGSVRFVKNNNSDVIRFCLLDQIINCKDLTQKNECFMNQICRSSSESVSYTKEPVCECIIQTGFGKLIHCKNPSKRNTNKTCRSQSCTQGPDQPESWINHSNWINWFIAKIWLKWIVLFINSGKQII